MKVQRLVAACTSVALVGLMSVTSTAQAAAPAFAPVTFSRYVALGDSYTSAPLVPLPELLSLGCLRSINSYPKQLAAQLHVSSFVDASCGGADTTHMTQPQSTTLGTALPQFHALRSDTDLVTVGIGGNDFGVFGSIVGTCPGLRAGDPAGAPCKEHFTVGGKDTLAAKLVQTQARITEVVNGIKQRSPKAKIVLVGYPKIAPEKGFCPGILPFADGDYAYLYSIEQKLNQAVENAAKAGGAVYVDTFGPSTGHDACAPDGEAWIQGKDINLLRAANYHPRYEGQAGVASLTYKKLTGKPATVTPAEQAQWAVEARELSRKAAKTTSNPATQAYLDRLRTGAQR
ncbi:SGNH/GDSL hydrolase family protein [Kribbella sp. NPDC056861]|uniref:SGNH/GDSL hydrolase family protein n=1 Tax=Kribbella sp. NPDC056861 TaxID=3154857 RepID=UPI003442D785